MPPSRFQSIGSTAAAVSPCRVWWRARRAAACDALWVWNSFHYLASNPPATLPFSPLHTPRELRCDYLRRDGSSVSLFMIEEAMTFDAQRIVKHINEDRRQHKSRERSRKKHLVAATLPKAMLSSKYVDPMEKKNHGQSSNDYWIAKSILLMLILVSTWYFKRHAHAPTTTTTPIAISAPLLKLVSEIAGATAVLPCSGHGYLLSDSKCKCYECFGGADCSQTINTCVINLDHGDPTLFEEYWFRNGANSISVILGYQRMSYFAQSKHVWFMENELDEQIRALHHVVGNAVTEGRHIVVGTGSTQLFQAALYALTSPDQPTPTNVVAAAPYYSSYPPVTDYLRSALFKWAGDAAMFDPEPAPYIEMVTSPGNPDGKINHAVVKGTGHVMHDLAYYWPHYTPITEAADHDIMLFTLSKSTGHAGTRIGWAILKDANVAMRMTKFMELNTIGVSHDSQVRATQIIKAVVQGYTTSPEPSVNNKLFHHGSTVMQYRWKRLRAALNASSEFQIPETETSNCTFFHKEIDSSPAFAWIKCMKVVDCQAMLKNNKIITRGGQHFGVGTEFVRLSMLDRHQKFELLVDRLAKIDSSRTPD